MITYKKIEDEFLKKTCIKINIDIVLLASAILSFCVALMLLTFYFKNIIILILGSVLGIVLLYTMLYDVNKCKDNYFSIIKNINNFDYYNLQYDMKILVNIFKDNGITSIEQIKDIRQYYSDKTTKKIKISNFQVIVGIITFLTPILINIDWSSTSYINSIAITLTFIFILIIIYLYLNCIYEIVVRIFRGKKPYDRMYKILQEIVLNYHLLFKSKN